MRTKEKEIELFEKIPVWRAIVNLALPSVMGQIILVIYNMADTFFVGMTASDAKITAVTVCMPAFMFLSAISNLFGVGGASVISRMLGVKNKDGAKHASQFAVFGCAAVALLYSLGAWLFLDLFVDLLGGADKEVHELACSYMMLAVVGGGVVTALNTLFSHLVRAEGRSMQASLGIIIGGVLNILFDPLFMFVILEPGNEVLGAALATMLSNLCALIYFLIVIIKNRSKLVLSLKPERAMFREHIPKNVISIGTPACLMTLCENISYAILDNMMYAAGTVAQAGVGVAKKVNMLAHCVVRGMAQGVLPLIGYNYASGNKKRMRHTVYLSAAMSVSVSVVCMIVCIFFAGPLVGLFLKDGSESLAFGERFLRILCIGAPFSACAYTVISFFQATGHMFKSLTLALMRKGILDIPLMFILNRFVPIYGIVAATPAADIICCITALVLFFRFIRRHAADGTENEAEKYSHEEDALAARGDAVYGDTLLSRTSSTKVPHAPKKLSQK